MSLDLVAVFEIEHCCRKGCGASFALITALQSNQHPALHPANPEARLVFLRVVRHEPNGQMLGYQRWVRVERRAP